MADSDPWDSGFEASPANTDSAGRADDEILETRKRVRYRFRNWSDFADATLGDAAYGDTGRLSPLAARPGLIEEAATALPTTLLKPDGTSIGTETLTIADRGYLAIDRGFPYMSVDDSGTFRWGGVVGSLGLFASVTSTHQTGFDATNGAGTGTKNGWQAMLDTAGTAIASVDIVVPAYRASGSGAEPDQPLLFIEASVQVLEGSGPVAVRVMAEDSGGTDATLTANEVVTDDDTSIGHRQFIRAWFTPDPSETYTCRIEGRTASGSGVFNDIVGTTPTGATLSTTVAVYLVGTASMLNAVP